MLRLSEDDHAKVAVAVAEAEANSNGEIVTIATALSDKYHDVALHWAVPVLIAVLAFYAAVPSQPELGRGCSVGRMGRRASPARAADASCWSSRPPSSLSCC